MKKSYCPIDTFINVIKGKRKSTIILHLSLGNKRYNELVKLIPDISERMMSKQLKELEADIHRKRIILVLRVYMEDILHE